MTHEILNQRYTAMFVPPVAPFKAWTTKIVFVTMTMAITLPLEKTDDNS